MLYKAGRPALKVCGLPVPTARKYRYTYSRLYSESHIIPKSAARLIESRIILGK